MNDAIAPWYTMILPRLFGTKIVEEAQGCRITSYKWRGEHIVAKIEFLAERSAKNG